MLTAHYFTMSHFSDLFYPQGTAIEKKSLSVPKEDYDFIREVFPEHGLANCITAFFFHTVAERLRQRGINSFHDREAQGFSIKQLQSLVQGRDE